METGKIVDFRTVPPVCIHMFRGWLQHDNKLWDRQCTKCGYTYMSEKLQTLVCPRCSGQVGLPTDKSGDAYCTSEGTFKVALYKGTKELWMEKMEKNTKLLIPVYRFKVYSHALGGPLTLPTDHHLMKKGALVELIIRNHLPLHSDFHYEKKYPGRKGVQNMFVVDARYGDTIQVIKKAKEGDMTVPIDTNIPNKLSDQHKAALMQQWVEMGKKLGINLTQFKDNTPVVIPTSAPAPAPIPVLAINASAPVTTTMEDAYHDSISFAGLDLNEDEY